MLLENSYTNNKNMYVLTVYMCTHTKPILFPRSLYSVCLRIVRSGKKRVFSLVNFHI